MGGNDGESEGNAVVGDNVVGIGVASIASPSAWDMAESVLEFFSSMRPMVTNTTIPAARASTKKTKNQSQAGLHNRRRTKPPQRGVLPQ